eukprot:Tbor_TRINITY_DN4769_c0_g2::TRINITY_DN4769_c0_g2_i1::g.17008::m.17008/K15356/VRG4, GONST1; GDP-mannose transporter
MRYMVDQYIKPDVIGSMICYSGCSVSMIILNKLVIATYNINFPMGLLFMQNITAVILVVFLKKIGVIYFPNFDIVIVKKWLPLTILFVGMLWTSMKSLHTMSVAVQTILKNIAIVLTALGDSFFFEKKLSMLMFVSFGMMVIGSTLGTMGDPWVTKMGLFWTFSNIIFTVSYVLYMKLLMGEVSNHIGRYGPVFYNNLLSLPFLSYAGLSDMPKMIHVISEAPTAALFCIISMMLVGSVMTFATFWCMKVTSPTTYSVTGAINKIPLSVLGVFIFAQWPTPMGWVGITIGLCGGLLYTYLNLPKPKPVEEA